MSLCNCVWLIRVRLSVCLVPHLAKAQMAIMFNADIQIKPPWESTRGRRLQPALARDLAERLAVLARGLGDDFFGHGYAVFAFEAGGGEPVAEVLLGVC
jgi:hypothetical protein